MRSLGKEATMCEEERQVGERAAQRAKHAAEM